MFRLLEAKGDVFGPEAVLLAGPFHLSIFALPVRTTLNSLGESGFVIKAVTRLKF
jgi:hypothetical protein